MPVILIHGYGASPEFTWEATFPLFERAGYVQGRTLVAVRLPGSAGPQELFREAGLVRAEIDRARRETGAAQVDLVGHSQGGLIAGMLATGESAALVRRAVSVDAPHAGILPNEAIDAMLIEAGASPALRLLLPVPSHLRQGSPALRTLIAREERFADRRSPALAIGSLWQEGAPTFLHEQQS